ncbi:PAS domain-containing protein [Azohydromonas caseinilytica]|uniref:histidine kinase n=1 Tax=Azohydromonas caseinilytica TaxID=2728836 RepID=A0A848FF93_9BURK|nr:PAS domain-containing protein [Azohydromonas caseinilytica]NML16571.1 PAS domain-containing protein [Azohydromonas caseinilytica]
MNDRALLDADLDLPWGGGAAFVVDHELRYLMADGEALHAAGLRPEDLVGKTIFEALEPALVREVEPRYRQALAGEPFSVEHESHGRHYRTRGVPLRDGAGRICAALAVSQDITAQREAQALHARLQDWARGRAYLLRLNAALRPLGDAAAIQREASRVLREHLGADRVACSEWVSTDEVLVVAADQAPGRPVLEGRRLRLSDYGQGLEAEFGLGRTTWRENVGADPRHSAAEQAGHAALQIAAWANAPLVKGGRLVAMLTVQFAAAHAWTADELTLIEETAERTWAAAERERAESALAAEHARLRATVAALHQSEQRFRLLVEAISQAVWEADAEGRIVTDSPSWRAYTGQSLEQWLGEGWAEAVHPQDRAFALRQWREAVAARRRVDAEFRLCRAGGGWSWTHVQAAPLLDAEGRVLKWVGMNIDVSGRRRAEETLSTVANLVPDLLWRNDPAGRVEWFNERWYEYTGQARDEGLGERWVELLHPEDRQETQRLWREALAREQTLMREHRLRGRDGAYRWFLVRAEPFRDHGGRVCAWFGSATDVHEQRLSRELLEQRVAERTQALRQLLAHLEGVQDEERRRIARELHDGLGQVLSSVALGLSALRQAPQEPAAREKLERLHELMQRLDRELDRIVFILRPTALEDCGLGEGVMAYVQTWSELTGVAVDLELHGLERARLSAPVEAATFRVVQEALTNVAKHARATRVGLSLERRRGLLVGSIEDDGMGFDSGEGAGAAGRAHWGLLGMQERIETLGGSFSIESRPGQGTAVLWRVPLG